MFQQTRKQNCIAEHELREMWEGVGVRGARKEGEGLCG